MTVSSIGSTFSWVPPQMALADAAPKERIAEAAESEATGDRDQRAGTESGSGDRSSSGATTATLRTSSAGPQPELAVAIQSGASTSVSAREAATAYTR